jgi:N-methylhydantoinase A
VLGYLDPGRFLGGRMSLDRELALAALARLGEELSMEPEEVAVGIFRIINAHMADLIRKTTIEQGHDPRECVLIAYGGAGPTHAAFYGRDINVKAIMVPPESTAFSAEGMLTCDVIHTEQGARFLAAPFSDEDFGLLTDDFARLEDRVLGQFMREGSGKDEVSLSREVGVRYRKQAHTLTVELAPGQLTTASAQPIRERFEQRYAHTYGEGAVSSAGIELEAQTVSGTRTVKPPPLRKHELVGGDGSGAVTGERQAYFAPHGFVTTPVLDGTALHAGEIVRGPAILQRMGDSVVVPDGFQAEVDAYLTLSLRPIATPEGGAR